MKQKTITLGGVIYDASTGLPLEKSAVAHRDSPSSQNVHVRAQRSTTLNRKIAAKTTHTIRPDITRSVKKPTTKHPLVSKFSDISPVKTTKINADEVLVTPVADIAPQTHPIIEKTLAKSKDQKAAKATAATLSAHQIKQHSIATSLSKAPAHNAPHSAKQHRTEKPHRFSGRLSLAAGAVALLLLAAYFTYLNMPSLSMRVAAAQAGINASYPGYQPDGYSLSGPIAYNTGEVTVKFSANAGPQSYILTQTRSDWDSTAVEQNYAEPKWGDNVTVIQASGLTIYQHNSNAAWVNGGILYTISGNAPLSQDQITHLATSM